MRPRNPLRSSRDHPAPLNLLLKPHCLAAAEHAATGAPTAIRNARGALAAEEMRRALLEKRRDALAEVLRVAELALQVTLNVELLLERALAARVDRLFDTGGARSGCASEPRRQLLDDAGEIRVRHAAPDEAPLLCLLGTERIAEQRQAERPRPPDQARQHP